MNHRRQFMFTLGTALASNATLLRAQTPAGPVRRVGVVTIATPAEGKRPLIAFFDEMSRLGWIEGRNVVYDWAAADGQPELLDPRTVELVTRQPDAIFAAVLPSALAARRATATIPIVFGSVNHPVEAGLVNSITRPGGNATGITPNWDPLAPKRIQLLREIMPKVKRVGYFRDASSTDDLEFGALAPVALALGITISPVKFTEQADLDAAMAALVAARVEAIHAVSPSSAIYYMRGRLVELANRARVPVITSLTPIAEAGALFSYGGAFDARFRRSAQLIDKILRGARPADIPVEQSTETEFIVNAKAARLLGITIPPAILLRADRVIE